MSIDTADYTSRIQGPALQVKLPSMTNLERRMQDMEAQRDQAFRNGTVLDVKFENGRWYAKMADDVTVNSDGTGTLAKPEQTGTAPTQDPNFKSDWLPWATMSHDAITVGVPPRVGQRVTLSAPYGRPEMGTLAPYHTGPTNPLPSGNPDEIHTQIKPHDQKPTTNNPKPPDGSAPNTTLDVIQNSGSHATQVSSTTQDGQAQGPYSRTEHTNNDKTITTQKVTQKTEQSKIKEAAQDTISRGTGTSDPEAADAGDGAGGGNLPHEMNRQMQGLRAAVTQNQHHIAALHDVMSQLNTIAQTVIPQLSTLDPFLLSKPENLKVAADNVESKLTDYMAQAMNQMVSKLTNAFMGSVLSLAQSNGSSSIQSVLSQIGTLASGSNIDISAPMAQAQAAVPAASGGDSSGLLSAVGAMAPAFNGAGQGMPFMALQGQLGGVLSSGASLMSGLSGMTDSQSNLITGMTRSYRLGGYA